MADSAMAMAPSNSGSKPPCPFLDKLPGELRNDIYELAFSSDHEPDAPVNLIDAKPPQRKALLATCRQVYKEAKEIYVDAYRKHWKQTKFVILQEHLDDEKHLWDTMSNLSPTDLDNMKHLIIGHPCYGSGIISQYVMENSVTRYEFREDADDSTSIVWVGWVPWADGYIGLVSEFNKKDVETEVDARASKIPLHLRLIDLVWLCSENPEKVRAQVSIESLYRRWGRLQDYNG